MINIVTISMFCTGLIIFLIGFINLIKLSIKFKRNENFSDYDKKDKWCLILWVGILIIYIAIELLIFI